MEKRKRRRIKDKSDQDDDDDSDDEVDDEVDEQIMDEGVNDIERLTIENGANLMDTNDISENTQVSSTENQDGMETNEDAVFKITVGPQSSNIVTDNSEGASDNAELTEVFMPSPRMNALMVVKNNQLFLYGGIYEDGDKQYTLSDFYSLDLHKLDEWHIIIKNDLKTQVNIPFTLLYVLKTQVNIPFTLLYVLKTRKKILFLHTNKIHRFVLGLHLINSISVT